MSKLTLTALIIATAAFDAFAIGGTWFTLAWASSTPPISAVGFWLFASSPLLITAYVIAKVRAFRSGR